MTDKETLEKAIGIAVKNGLTGYWADRYKFCQRLDEMEYLIDGDNLEDGHPVETLIYNHEFAKALWGEDKTYSIGFGKKKLQRYEWQHKLQQMVIADNPIAYLRDNLPEDV